MRVQKRFPPLKDYDYSIKVDYIVISKSYPLHKQHYYEVEVKRELLICGVRAPRMPMTFSRMKSWHSLNPADEG